MLFKNNKAQLKKKGADAYGDSWFPRHIVVGLSAAIEAERQASRRKDVIKMLREVRATGKFDEADPLQVGLLEPKFSDRYSRTPERTRERADRLLQNYRKQRPGKHGRGSGRYFARLDGIAAPTLCALMISIALRRPHYVEASSPLFFKGKALMQRKETTSRGAPSNNRGRQTH